jgi:hypothetical protein
MRWSHHKLALSAKPKRIVVADADADARRAADDYVVGSPLKAGG